VIFQRSNAQRDEEIRDPSSQEQMGGWPNALITISYLQNGGMFEKKSL